MKIVVTIIDASTAANVGGPVECKSSIIEIPEENVPELVKKYLNVNENPPHYLSISFSLLEE